MLVEAVPMLEEYPQPSVSVTDVVPQIEDVVLVPYKLFTLSLTKG